MPTVTLLLLSENVFVKDIKYTKVQGIIVFPIIPMEVRNWGCFLDPKPANTPSHNVLCHILQTAKILH